VTGASQFLKTEANHACTEVKLSHPRIDTSEHVYFANDQLAVRFIEEIDFDYAATDATAALLTAAS
jgi:hypothetical protein